MVDVRDVAMAHVLSIENLEASGRFLVANKAIHTRELSGILSKLINEKCHDLS